MRGFTTNSGILLIGQTRSTVDDPGWKMRTLHRNASVALGCLHQEQGERSRGGEPARTYRLTVLWKAPLQGGKQPALKSNTTITLKLTLTYLVKVPFSTPYYESLGTEEPLLRQRP